MVRQGSPGQVVLALVLTYLVAWSADARGEANIATIRMIIRMTTFFIRMPIILQKVVKSAS